MADFSLYSIDPALSDEPRGVRDMLPQFRQADGGTTGAMFQYQSPNVDVIGWLVERVTGEPLVDFIRQNIWAPLGAEHDAVFTTDVSFAPIATGGFNSTLRDAARFGLMALNDGCLDKQIAPESWMKDTYDLRDEDRPPAPPASIPMPHMSASLTASRAIAVSGGNLTPLKANALPWAFTGR